MPYGRSYSRRGRGRGRYPSRRRGPRRPAKPYRYQLADTAYMAYQMGKKALYLTNTEFKHHDVAIAQSPGTSLVLTTLNGPAQADSSTTRDGRSIKITTISLKGSLQVHASFVGTAVRVMLVEKKHNNLLALTAAELFDATSVLDVNSFYNLDNVPQNIKIWFDKVYILDPDHQPRVQINKNWSFENKKTHFLIGSTSGAVTTIETSAFYWCLVSSEATNVSVAAFTSRVRYIDN